MYASPFICATAIGCDEMYLLHPTRLPMGEPAYAVGQWGGWIATALVLIATLFGIFGDNREATTELTTAADTAVNASIAEPEAIHLRSLRRQTTIDVLQTDLR